MIQYVFFLIFEKKYDLICHRVNIFLKILSNIYYIVNLRFFFVKKQVNNAWISFYISFFLNQQHRANNWSNPKPWGTFMLFNLIFVLNFFPLEITTPCFIWCAKKKLMWNLLKEEGKCVNWIKITWINAPSILVRLS